MAIFCRENTFFYLAQLFAAGWEGVTSARQEVGGRVLTRPMQEAILPTAAVGAALGFWGARFVGRKGKWSMKAIGGVLGGVAGCGAALAWSSRRFVGPAYRKAAHEVNLARDAHWLIANPIDYA